MRGCDYLIIGSGFGGSACALRLAALGLELRADLAPHLAEARRMLGVTRNPRESQQDHFLQQTAERMGAAHTFGPVPAVVRWVALRKMASPTPAL